MRAPSRTATRRKGRRPKQGLLPFRNWGGPREGAGRKPKGDKAGVPHRTREALASRYPVHVTVRRAAGLPMLRQEAEWAALREAFRAGRERNGLRLVQWSIQRDHLHMVVEAKDRDALSRGMQGLLIRCARALNRIWKRVGTVWGDRYHAHILKTPREVRAALLYVLANARKHGLELRQALDRYASGWWFDGWRETLRITNSAGIATPVADARTWLLREGWRRHGLLSVLDVPG